MGDKSNGRYENPLYWKLSNYYNLLEDVKEIHDNEKINNVHILESSILKRH